MEFETHCMSFPCTELSEFNFPFYGTFKEIVQQQQQQQQQQQNSVIYSPSSCFKHVLYEFLSSAEHKRSFFGKI